MGEKTEKCIRCNPGYNPFLASKKELRKNPYMQGNDIVPTVPKNVNIENLIKAYWDANLEARNVARAAAITECSINRDYTTILGISGIFSFTGVASGITIEMMKKGHIDMIVSTGAQVYHDMHLAFGLPMKRGSPDVDDDDLRKYDVTRVYGDFILNRGTLYAQDHYIRNFLISSKFNRKEISNADYVHELGKFAMKYGKHPKRSWVVTAAKYGIPIFLDSSENHSMGMTNAVAYASGKSDVQISPSRGLLEATAIVYHNQPTLNEFLGEGGPRNFIQTLAPTISETLGIEFEGAESAIMFSASVTRLGALSGSTFAEALSWNKYKKVVEEKFAWVWGEYSALAPLVMLYALEKCRPRKHKKLFYKKDAYYENLISKSPVLKEFKKDLEIVHNEHQTH